MTTQEIAHIAYEVNRAYCKVVEGIEKPPWEMVSSETHHRVIRGVRNLCNNPDLTPEDMHKLWLDSMTDDGWKAGKEYDIEEKTHPCLVAYEKLSKEQQAKDHIFHNVVKAISNG